MRVIEVLDPQACDTRIMGVSWHILVSISCRNRSFFAIPVRFLSDRALTWKPRLSSKEREAGYAKTIITLFVRVFL